MSSTSNFERLGPAIAPTAAKRTKESTPAAAAEGVNPPIAKVAKRFIEKSPILGIDFKRAYKISGHYLSIYPNFFLFSWILN